jgi:hypothetical protein
MNRPNGISAVAQRHFSRSPTAPQPLTNGISAVAPNGISTVSGRLRCRLRSDSQVGLRHRRDFAGLTSRRDKQTSTRLRRGTSVGSDVAQADQNQEPLKRKAKGLMA